MDRRSVIIAAALALPALARPPRAARADDAAAEVARERTVGSLVPVFALPDAMPTSVTVAPNGRIFVNFPRWGDDVRFTVGEIRGGGIWPYPDAAMNRADSPRPAANLISVQSVVADARNRLWILDTAAPSFSRPQAGGAKLVAVDLASDRVVKTIVLGADVALPTTYLNDVRFDLRPDARLPDGRGSEGVAYITDSSTNGPGGLIVVDLASGRAWRRLSGHPSTQPDPRMTAIVEGELLMVRPANGPAQPFRVAADGIALSADGATLYYCPLTSRRLFAVPTALLRDRAVPEARVAAAVVDLGEKGASDGLEADDRGRIYASDYEHDAIRRRLPDGSWETVAHDPRMLWPDTLSVAPGFLYFTANQINRQPLFNRGTDLRRPPYMLFKVAIDAGPVRLA
jgi:sugar lactone lactonase YvrE